MTMDTATDTAAAPATAGLPARPLRADAERNRRRILVAAAEVFARRGLDAGLDEIARHAGVGTGTVYRRFPDKDVLIEALFEDRMDRLLELAQACAAMDDPWRALLTLLEGSVEMQLADRGLKDLIYGEVGCGERFTRKREQIMPLLAGVLQRAQEAGQVRADVTLTDLAVLQFTLTALGTFTAEVSPQAWRRHLHLLVDGLRAARPAPSPAPVAPLSLGEFEAICGHAAHGRH